MQETSTCNYHALAVQPRPPLTGIVANVVGAVQHANLEVLHHVLVPRPPIRAVQQHVKHQRRWYVLELPLYLLGTETDYTSPSPSSDITIMALGGSENMHCQHYGLFHIPLQYCHNHCYLKFY